MKFHPLFLAAAALGGLALAPAHADYILKVPAGLNGPAAGGSAATPVYQLSAYDQSNAPLASGYQFGNVQVGSAVTGTIRVTNTGNVANTLTSAGLSGGGESITSVPGASPCAAGLTLQPFGSCYLHLQFAPAAGTDYTAQAAVAGSNGAGASVAVSGTGTTSVALNAFDNNGNALTGAVSYGTVDVGQTAAVTHAGQVRNTGSAQAQLTPPVMAGSGAFVVVPSGGTANCGGLSALNPGTFCNVYVSFTPNLPGVLNATYTLGSTTGPEAVLALTGTGQALVPTLGAFTIPDKAVDDAPFELAAPSSSSTGAFSYSSSNTAVATVSGSTVTLVGQGSTTITAAQEAAGSYAAASTSATLDVGPAGVFITLSTDTSNYNLASAMGNPVVPVQVTVTINAGVTVSSTSAAEPAFATGVLPAGSAVTLVNNGSVLGHGGDGGMGGSCEGTGAPYSCTAPIAGQAGGAAIDTRVALTVQNAGTVAGGGGGGGGGGYRNDGTYGMPGCGGGGGVPLGAAGAAGAGTRYPALPGSAASSTAPGAGGVTPYTGPGNGGTGAVVGQAGASGTDGYTTYGAAGGAAGAAVLRNGNAVSVSGGTVVGPIVE